MIEICCDDRWQAYRRFLELDIDCQCRGYCPLLARVDSPSQAIQVWSTTQWISQKREALSQRLERCWQLELLEHRGGPEMRLDQVPFSL